MNQVQSVLLELVREQPGGSLTTYNELLGRGPNSRGGTSRDMRVLVEAGFVRKERDRQRVLHWPVES